MKQSDYFKFHEDLCNEARALSKRKNDDYADPDSRQHDPFAIFANFMQCDHLGICEVEQGFLVRLSDKMSRLGNILKPGHKQGVMDESIRDTALDIINYVALLLGYLETKRREAKRQQIAVDLEFSETMKQGLPEPPVETDEEKKAEARRRAMANLKNELGIHVKKSVDGAFGYIPEEVSDAAIKVENFFQEAGIEHWQLHGIQSRVDSTISDFHKELHQRAELRLCRAQAKLHEHRFMSDESAKREIRKHEEAKAEALHRDTWRWFLGLHPDLDLQSLVTKFESWRRRKEERSVSFVCPKCYSTYWGTVGVPGEPGCTGHCHGEQHTGKPCNFSWDRNVEDKFVGLGGRMQKALEKLDRMVPDDVLRCSDEHTQGLES